jgi:phenylacetate-CoA ligase
MSDLPWPLRPGPTSREVDVLAAEAVRSQHDPARLAATAATSARTVLRAAAAVDHYDTGLLEEAADALDAGAELAEALAGLPPLPRSTVRSRWRRLLAADPGPVRVTSTSGTGGTRTNAVKPEASFPVRAAIERRWYAGLGLPERLDVHIVVPWTPRHPHWRPFHDGRVRQRDVSVAEMLRGLRAASRAPTGILLSQPDVLTSLAAAAEHGWGRMQAVASSFEVLVATRREALLSADAPRLTESYCAADICTPLAFRWPSCAGLHVNEDTVHVEVLDWDGRRCPAGEPGRVTVTDLLNTAMPLVRYQLGDLGVLSTGGCPCGRRTRLLRLLGRETAAFRVGGGKVPAAPALAAAGRALAGEPFLLAQDDAGVQVVAGSGDEAVPALRELMPATPVAARQPEPAEAGLLRAGGLLVSTRTRIPLLPPGRTR